MAKTTNTESLIEAWKDSRCLDVNFVIYKNRYEKAKSRKKLAEQFSVTGTVKSSCCSCSLCFPFLIEICWIYLSIYIDFIEF